MCHPGGPETQLPAGVSRDEVSVPLATGETMPATLARPENPRGAVLLLTDIYGRTPFYLGLGARIAAEGYAALVPDTFFRQGDLPEQSRAAAMERRSRLDERQALEDARAVRGWLRDRFPAPSGRTAVLGFCLGGTLALHLAVDTPEAVTVAYYAFPRSLPGDKAVPPPLDVADRIGGGIIAFWGEEDELIDLPGVEQFSELMSKHGVDYQHFVYPGVGHGFLRGLDEPGAPEAEPAVDSWRRSLDFLHRHLSSPRA